MLNFKVKEFKSIVKEIEFKVYPKKISFIVGKNGLGKSNILDAIDWFVNGASNSSNSNNISSQSTSPNYNAKAIVSLKYKLSEERIKKINDILKEHSNILADGKLVNSYIEKTADSPAYNYLYESNGNLTELAEIINDLIKLYSEKWLDQRFFKVSTKGNYSVNLDLTREKLEKWTEITKDLKEKHIKLFDDIKLLESLYKERPIVIYIRNADLENKTKYSYYFDEYTQKEKNKEFMDLLRFLGNDVLNEMTRLTEMNSVDENGEKQANKIINRIDKAANTKLKELFTKFDIYGYPEIKTHDTKINIEVRSKEEYEYDDVDTEFNSSGYKAFYQLMLNLENAKYYVKTNNQKVIILADEPDKNLHPLLQQQLADYLTDFAKNNPDIYLIITTHSPFLLKDLKNDFYITERTVNLTENCKKEGSTFFSYFKAKMPDKINKFQNLYTLLVASELYSDDKSFYSSLSEKYIIYTNGDSSVDTKLRNSLNKIGINDIKIRPLNYSISNANKIFSNASICEYFSEITNINDIIKIREKLEKGEIVLFRPKQKEKLKETHSEMSIQLNELVNSDEEVIN